MDLQYVTEFGLEQGSVQSICEIFREDTDNKMILEFYRTLKSNVDSYDDHGVLGLFILLYT